MVPAPPSLSWTQVWAFRAARHSLVERRRPDELLDVVGELCGLHAQVMSSAEACAAARIDDLPADAVREALWGERTLFKTWGMRGTLHLFPTREFNLWAAAFATLDHYLRPAWLNGWKITREEMEALLEALDSALEEPRTREELAAAVESASGRAELAELVRGSWGSMLKPAAFRGRLVFADSDGQKVRFVKPARWLRTTRERVVPEEGRLEVVRRYLAAYGPASREALSRWWGWASPAQARRLMEAAGAVAVDLEGVAAWALPEDLGDLRSAAPSKTVRLLGQFDQYVVGAWRDQPDVAPVRRLVYREAGWISAVVLVDGRIAGTWKAERGAPVVTLFAREPAWVRKAVAEEAARLGLPSPAFA